MVLRRSDARHKDVPDSVEPGPKRVTTIHAQRKFAQGSGMNSPIMSPTKEKNKVNGTAGEPSPSSSPTSSAIPSKRPRTEDFITFLCYRGTPVLPPSLNSFNIPSKPDKSERDMSSPAGSSKQTSCPGKQDKDGKKHKKVNRSKGVVMQSKSKVLDQRQRKSRINAISQKAGKVLKSKNVSTPISKEILKKVASAVINSGRKPLKGRTASSLGRASHLALLKRLGNSRARVGLRSGGQLPPGSDVGIKTERKPRSEKLLKNKTNSSSLKKGQFPVRMKSKLDNKATPTSNKSKKGGTIKEKGQVKATPPKNLTLMTRPSRKTKEAAAMYMELITKDLRSPEEEEEDISDAKSPEIYPLSVKTRTRSGNVEETPDTPDSSSKLTKKKSSFKKSQTAKSPSPAPAVRRSLKLATPISPSPKVTKRTRNSRNDEPMNECPSDDDSNVKQCDKRQGKKPLKSDKNDKPTPKTRTTKQNVGGAGKKRVDKKGIEDQENEESSHSEYESPSGQPTTKRPKKGNETSKVERPTSAKKQGVPKTASLETPKRLNSIDKTTPKGTKRSTRSGGMADTSPAVEDKESNKPMGRKVQSKKTKTCNKSPPNSGTEESDEDMTGTKAIIDSRMVNNRRRVAIHEDKQDTKRQQRSIKSTPKVSESDSDEESSKHTNKKPTRNSRASQKKREKDIKPKSTRKEDIEGSDESTADEKEADKKPTRISRGSIKNQELSPPKRPSRSAKHLAKEPTSESENESDEQSKRTLSKRQYRSTKQTTREEMSADESEEQSKQPEPTPAKRSSRTVKQTAKEATSGEESDDQVKLPKKNETASNKRSSRSKKPITKQPTFDSSEELDEEPKSQPTNKRASRTSKQINREATSDSEENAEKKKSTNKKSGRVSRSYTKNQERSNKSEPLANKRPSRAVKQISKEITSESEIESDMQSKQNLEPLLNKRPSRSVKQILKEPFTESEDESDEKAKHTIRKTQSRASKGQEPESQFGGKSAMSKRPVRSSKLSKKETESESDEESDQPNQNKPDAKRVSMQGRVSDKNQCTETDSDHEKKPTNTQSRPIRNSAVSKDDQIESFNQRRPGRPRKSTALCKDDDKSNPTSESEEEKSGKSPVRRSKNTKSMNVNQESDDDRKPVQSKQTRRAALQSAKLKSDESESEDAKILKNVSKNEEYDKVSPNSKKRVLPSKMDITEDVGLKEGVSKRLFALKQSGTGSGSESDKDVTPKRAKSSIKVAKETDYANETQGTPIVKNDPQSDKLSPKGSPQQTTSSTIYIGESKWTSILVSQPVTSLEIKLNDASDNKTETLKKQKKPLKTGIEPHKESDKKDINLTIDDKPSPVVNYKRATGSGNEQSDMKSKDVETKSPEVKKRGRKPKNKQPTSQTDVSTTEPIIEDNRTRPQRRRAAVKRESYSEFSDEEIDIPLPRTRERKSNVKYAENDTEDEESETEKRPRRPRRSVFGGSIGLDLDSEEDFIAAVPVKATRKTKRTKTMENDKKSKVSSESDEEKEDHSKPTAVEKQLASTTPNMMNTDDGSVSDSSSKKSKPAKTSKVNTVTTVGITTKTDVDQYISDEQVTSGTFEDKLKSAMHVVLNELTGRMEFSKYLPENEVEAKCFSVKQEQLPCSTTNTGAPGATDSNMKGEPKRVTRRMSKDKPDNVDIPVQIKVETQLIEQVVPQPGEGKSHATSPPHLPGSFNLSSSNKGGYEDTGGLATLADVAFSELQNRQSIMERKMSSDSATSFSSDDVPLPVRKEKVLPKAKADLPTIREKTESDEELSDVGNEETDDDSSYDEYRKSGKQQTRRKRLPRRTRKEPVKQQSQRAVHSRRAKLTADSYIDDDSYSSDRSSTPDIPHNKPIPKKRRKSDDKLSLPSSSIIPRPVSLSSVPTTLTATEPLPHLTVSVVNDSKQQILPSVKQTREIKPYPPPKEDAPKVLDTPRNIPMKKPLPKSFQPTEPLLTIPRRPTAPPMQKDVPIVDAKNNNSVTLFAGITGVQVMQSENKIAVIPSVPKEEIAPQAAHSFSGSNRTSLECPAKPLPYVPSRSPAVPSSQTQVSQSNIFNKGVTTESAAVVSIPEVKMKPNIGDTWKNAFINAKILKTGQLSPAHHSSGGAPFMRKFPNVPRAAPKPEEVKTTAFVPAKLPGVQTFKNSPFQNLGKLGSQSPSRMQGGMSPGRPPISGHIGEPKSHVYLSPSRVKNSPSKSDDKCDIKKTDCAPTKSLTLLQYEKRSQELISSLKESQPVLVEGSHFVPAYPTKLKEYSMEKIKSAPRVVQQPPPPPVEESTKSESGKHLNLPFAVEQAFRKRSPITVKKPVKLQVEKRAGVSITIPEVPAVTIPNVPRSRPITTELPRPEPQMPIPIEPNRTTTNLDILSKKKVQMTSEEIKKWLDDDTSSGVEHSKNCGIFENNQCECSFRTSSESMMNTSVGMADLIIKKEESKVDHGVVEPPVQLKELDTADKFTAETISTCKVEDYKEKMLSKASKVQLVEVKKELVPPGTPKSKKPINLVVDKAKRKSSMTEDEMCEFDFRFERTSNSPRESCSDMSSPTQRDDISSSNEDKFDPTGQNSLERKSIFQQRRQLTQTTGAPKRPLSKSPCAFSAENESSVYAFEPDAPPPTVNNPFRRRGSRHKSSEDDGPGSSSIAVQVNLENVASSDNEQVLECSTQTEQVDNEGQLFYFPLEGDSNPQEVIQGVQVKLQSTEGPEQKVIMKAKLVTKPSPNPAPSPVVPTSSPTRPLGDVGRISQRPEQKVRPLASTSTSTQIKPPVGTVQPTLRDPQPSCSATFTSQGTATITDRPELTNTGTQAAAVPQEQPSTAPKHSEQPPPVEAKHVETKHVETKPVEPPPPPPTKASTKSSGSSRRGASHGFPLPGSTPKMVDAPTFYPTEKEFQDPLEYIEQITPQAQAYGICRIVPPSSFKPECKVNDEMRFTAYNQYVHKMLYRWGPNVRELTAIKKYLATQSITLKQPPYIGGLEIDLPRLYQTVQSCGGLNEVIEKKRWAKVADLMKIPRGAQERVTKLDQIYCKFLLPYDTLCHSERNKLLEEVDAEWTERERRMRIALEAERESKEEKDERDDSESEGESDDGRDECITKGRTMPLSGFFRIARNTMTMWFREPHPSAKDVESEYWKQVTSRRQHVCVNSGSIDSGTHGYGFPTSKSSSTSKHPWNLKVLTNNSGSILRSMGPLMGVTVPTLHVGMLFSACCWYRDPHGLPWIEYAHTGASKIWYGVPDLWNEELHGAMRTILPRYCQDKPIWLASDTAMVPPDLLVQQGVALCRAVQEPGQFILVFPKAFTSTICTGYVVSESVYFAQPSWLDTASQIFKDIQESCEPPAFSLERLLFNIATDVRASPEVLTQVLPMVVELRDTELKYRKELADLGVTDTERLAVSKGRKKSQEEPQEYECEICRGNLYLSLVTNSVEEANFCLLHSVETLTKDRSHVKNCKLMYSYDEEEMDELLEKMKQRIETKFCKKQNNKSGGSSK